MFRIRKVLDNTSSANREAITQVLSILAQQFPTARKEEFSKLPEQLNDPLKYKYRSILFVAENAGGKVKGFAMLLHFPDIGVAYLELISAAPGQTSGGIGGALYEYVREECLLLKVKGLFFECSIDDPKQIKDPVILKQNIARLKFYERYGVYPIINHSYATPVNPGDEDLYYLMMDELGTKKTINSGMAQKIVRAILERKYGEFIPQSEIDHVVQSFTDKILRFREPRYIHKPVAITRTHKDKESIVLVVNEGHSIHHVKDRGYVEAPVRLSTILTALGKTELFKRVEPKRVSEAFIKKVHSAAYVDYLRRACAALPPGNSHIPLFFHCVTWNDHQKISSCKSVTIA